MESIDVAGIAKVAHEINKVYCEAHGDKSQLSWEDAPQWQKDSAYNGVIYHINTDNPSPSASHKNWLAEKEKEGWVYGEIKDVEKKEHPCFLPYDELPVEQKVKDYLFGAICKQLKNFL